MNKTNLGIIIGAVVLITVIIVGRLVWFNDQPSGITLFYSENCPHCQNVEKFLQDNQVGTKVDFDLKPTDGNENNIQEMLSYTKKCDIDINQVGVPFLFDGTTCLIGDQPIIDFFQNKIK